MELTLIGPGKMALALALGLEKEYALTIVGRDGERLLQFTESLKRHAKTALLPKYEIDGQTVILSIKPHALEEVGKQLKGKASTLYSIVAGVEIATLKKVIKADYYVRAMPNLAARHFASMSALCGDKAKKEEALDLFASVGSSVWLESEKDLDVATAIAGSGPAFLALVAEALADGGVACGLGRKEAMRLVEGLFQSSSALLSNEHPALIKDSVMSPAGTTASGVEVLEEKAVRSAFIRAVKEAYERAKNAK